MDEVIIGNCLEKNNFIFTTWKDLVKERLTGQEQKVNVTTEQKEKIIKYQNTRKKFYRDKAKLSILNVVPGVDL